MGGLRMVGENGPELEWTGPSRIFNADQTHSIVGNGDTAAEIRAMRIELNAALIAIAQNTRETSKHADRTHRLLDNGRDSEER